jgi:hypothetical protein
MNAICKYREVRYLIKYARDSLPKESESKTAEAKKRVILYLEVASRPRKGVVSGFVLKLVSRKKKE